LWQQGLAIDYEGFVSSLQTLNPAPGEPIFFRSMPRLFDAAVLGDAVAVVLRQPDVDVRLVEQCPANARYCLRFVNSQLFQDR
jgi:hypothetical protein